MTYQQNDLQPGSGNQPEDTSAIFSGDSSLQTPAEFEKDKHGNHEDEDNKVSGSGIDNLEDNSDGAAGTDRAGTAERKQYGDPELNKGLEAQAMDEES
ncbi:MAG TPA: hypothetical protein VF610_06765 [Segetibacter sp.]|jgi:hypothetical protein